MRRELPSRLANRNHLESARSAPDARAAPFRTIATAAATFRSRWLRMLLSEQPGNYSRQAALSRRQRPIAFPGIISFHAVAPQYPDGLPAPPGGPVRWQHG